VNADVAQAIVRIMRHWDRSLIQSEDDLRRDLKMIVWQAEIATKLTLNININRILEAAVLMVSR